MSGQVNSLARTEGETGPEVPGSERGSSAQGRRCVAVDPAPCGVAAIDAGAKRKGGAAKDPDQPVGLGETDRSESVCLPPDESRPLLAQVFGRPDVTFRGWEIARDTHARVGGAVPAAVQGPPGEGEVPIVPRCEVGTLLRRHPGRTPITRNEGRPHPGGGCRSGFGRALDAPAIAWSAIS